MTFHALLSFLMNRLIQFFNKLYLNIAKVFGWIALFVFFTFFVLFSTQYIGESISYHFLKQKQSVFLFVFDDTFNDKNYINFIKKMTENNRLREIKVKSIIAKQNNTKILNGDFNVIITKNKDIIQQLSNNNVLSPINHSLFDEKSYKFIEYSDNNEYVKADTHYNTEIYIGISNKLTSLETTKTMMALKSFNNFAIKKTLY